MVSACFPPGSLECWYLSDRGCLYDQYSINILGVESLLSFSGIWHVLSLLAAAGVQRVLCDSLKRGLLKLEPGSFCHMCLSPGLIFFFFLYLFTQLNQSCEYNYTRVLCGPWLAASTSAGKLIEMQILGPSTQTLWIRISEGPVIHLIQPSQWLVYIRAENYCSVPGLMRLPYAWGTLALHIRSLRLTCQSSFSRKSFYTSHGQRKCVLSCWNVSTPELIHIQF